MSRENVEIVRRAYASLSEGDVQAWISMLSPDIELDERYLAPDAKIYRGHDGIREWLRAGLEAFEWPRFEVLRWFEREDVVVTELTVHLRGTSSGAEVTARLAHAFRVRDGRVRYIASFPAVEEALKAVGLSESRRTPP